MHCFSSFRRNVFWFMLNTSVNFPQCLFYHLGTFPFELIFEKFLSIVLCFFPVCTHVFLAFREKCTSTFRVICHGSGPFGVSDEHNFTASSTAKGFCCNRAYREFNRLTCSFLQKIKCPINISLIEKWKNSMLPINHVYLPLKKKSLWWGLESRCTRKSGQLITRNVSSGETSGNSGKKWPVTCFPVLIAGMWARG